MPGLAFQKKKSGFFNVDNFIAIFYFMCDKKNNNRSSF